ncbi:polysaccharide deacetylase family protein [Desulfosporosinus sp. SB140]|uniref:polysaccharide deacetylase family protein n=1 Tax=Desulfosporosinus paludis TaxID=3115649 RepID=UPI00388EB56B
MRKTIGLLVLIVLLFGNYGCSFEKPSLTQHEVKQHEIEPANSYSVNFPVESSSALSKGSSCQEIKAPSPPVPVLYYHSVMREDNNEIRMPPEQFEGQMAYLQSQGYHSISLYQLYESLYHEGTLPAKPFVITFDDGYADNYLTAFPILKKYGFVATIFMVSSFVNGKGFLTWPELKELSENGWDIEDHTLSHPYLTTLNRVSVLKELKTSKEALEKGLGHSVDFFAYPYGDYNDEIVGVVKNTGYVMAFTTLRGWADSKTDTWHVHRVYCYANMGLNEFIHRIRNPKY